MSDITPKPEFTLWGQQTDAALQHFRVGQETLPDPIIRAYGLVKYCAADTHQQHGRLEPRIAEAIKLAAKQLFQGQLNNQFPISLWQSGSGTQSHMNVNEVLATLATQTLDGQHQVHPNDHCNLGQSTNDSFPTALHIASVSLLNTSLLPALRQLAQRFENLSDSWQSLLKTGRTHLQDATPLSLGQEFSAYAAQLKLSQHQLESDLPDLLSLTMGGTAVGTGINSRAGFAAAFCDRLNELTGHTFKPSDNCFAGQASHDAIVALSGSLNTLASSLNKIASDLRLMASGPRCGLGELTLPANEPGSSIMPGKVNPSQCEMLNMVCAQVMGNHLTITMANAQGQFQLNTFKPVIALNIIQSLALLADAITSFDNFCVSGIKPNETQLQEMMEKSLMLATALTPHLGYDKVTEIVHYASEQRCSLRQAVIDLEMMSAAAYDRLIRPETMITPSSNA
jgi:fumarate hydratase class II